MIVHFGGMILRIGLFKLFKNDKAKCNKISTVNLLDLYIAFLILNEYVCRSLQILLMSSIKNSRKSTGNDFEHLDITESNN